MGAHQPFIPLTYLAKSSQEFHTEANPIVRTYIQWFVSTDDILEDDPEAIIHEIAQDDIYYNLCSTELCEEMDLSPNINYNTQQMEAAFTEDVTHKFSLRTYQGSIGCYSLIVNDVYLIRAVILPENFYYQRLHLWARGTIDMSKVIILVDSSLEDPLLELKGLRKFYTGRLDPILKECGADVWIVPPGFIGEYTAVPKLKLTSDIFELPRAVNAILETARSFIQVGEQGGGDILSTDTLSDGEDEVVIAEDDGADEGELFEELADARATVHRDTPPQAAQVLDLRESLLNERSEFLRTGLMYRDEQYAVPGGTPVLTYDLELTASDVIWQTVSSLPNIAGGALEQMSSPQAPPPPEG